MSEAKTREEVIESLNQVAAEMHDKMLKGEPPTMTLPVRSKTNIEFNKKLGVYKYGKKQTIRDATSLGSARQLLRALHVIDFIEEMIDTAKSSTLREMYYISDQHQGSWASIWVEGPWGSDEVTTVDGIVEFVEA